MAIFDVTAAAGVNVMPGNYARMALSLEMWAYQSIIKGITFFDTTDVYHVYRPHAQGQGKIPILIITVNQLRVPIVSAFYPYKNYRTCHCVI